MDTSTSKAYMTIVYKGTAKAIRNGAMSAEDRFVFLGDGSAAFWRGDRLTQSDVLYRKPDSHCEATDEKMPSTLKISQREMDHISDNGIKLPFDLVRDDRLL